MTSRAPFLGREEPLLELGGALDDALAGRGTVALVRGELGIGKTRLLEELAQRARGLGAIVAEGRWYESTEQPADIGLRDALAKLVADERVRAAFDTSNHYAQQLARLGPEFASALGPPARAAASLEGEQYQLWRAILLLLAAAAGVATTVVIFDDLQWADAGSIGLLAFLEQKIAGLPILLLGAYRQEDVPDSHPLHDALADLAHTPSFRPLSLAGLSPDDVARLAESISGVPVSERFAVDLQRLTQGNPLFISEVVRHLVGAGRLRAGKDAELPRMSDIEVPERLQQVLHRRVTALSEPCRSLLGRASVIGREFDLALMERAGCAERGSLLGALDEAQRSATLHEVSAGHFDFAHPLVRSVLYASLPASQRVEGHLNVAKALLDYYGPNADTHAREIARHLLAASGTAEPTDVLAYCLSGARQAREGFALEEARSLAKGGLAAWERLPDPSASLRARLLLELGYAETGLGNPDGAIAVYREAIDLYEALGSQQEALDARRRLAATMARYGRWSEVLAVTRPRLEAAAEEASDPYLGLVGSHAMALIISGAAEEARPWVLKSLALAFDGSTRAVANHVAACWHSWATNDAAQAAVHFREAQRLFQQEGLVATASQVALDYAIVSYFVGRPEDATSADRDAERLATETGRLSVLADLYGFRSLASTHRGDWALAGEQRARCRAIAARLGGSTIYGQLVERGEALEAGWREGPAAARPFLKSNYPLPNEALLSHLLAAEGEQESANQVIDKVLAIVPADGSGLFWFSFALPIAATLTTLDRPEAQAWCASLCAYSGGLFDWTLADLECAEIHAKAERWEEADASVQRAIAMCEERGLRPFLGLSYYHRALHLFASRSRVKRREAGVLLGQAEEIFVELGLGYLREKVHRLRVLPTRGRPRSEGPSGLTRREMTVLSLLAGGRSNREIAEELYVAEKTVARHLESVYRKLGVPGRGAAIAWAHQNQSSAANGTAGTA